MCNKLRKKQVHKNENTNVGNSLNSEHRINLDEVTYY